MEREEIIREIEKTFGFVPGWLNELPDSAINELWTLQKNLLATETHIPSKYKELIGLAVAATLRCRYCAYFHTELAKLDGATEEEIKEAILLGSVVNLFSTYLNGSQYDLERFKEETDKMLESMREKVVSIPA